MLLTIMINVAHAVVKDTLITPGERLPEVVTPARAELFTISVNLVLRLRLVLMALQLRIILLLVVLLDIQQHGHLVAVLEVIINGMDIITFCARCVDV